MILFYWLVAIMPLEEHWLWGYPLFGTFTVMKALGFACILVAAYKFGTSGRSPRSLYRVNVRSVIVFIVIIALSAISSLPESRPSAYSHILSVVSLVCVVVALVDNPARFNRTLLTAMGAAGFASLYTIRQQQHYGAGFRAGGVSGDSNYFALLVGLWVPLAFVWAFSRRPTWERLYCVACLGVMLLGSTVAASRGGFLGMAASLLYLIIRSNRPTRNLLVASVLVVPLLLIVPSSPLRRFRDPDAGDRFGEQARIIAWKSGLRMIEAHPVSGVGLHNFKTVILQYEDPTWSTEVTNYQQITTLAHNTYVELAAEAGLPGLISFLGVIFVTFKCLERIRRLTRAAGFVHPASIALGLQAGLLSFTVSAFFLSAWWQKMFWLLICLTIPLSRLSASMLRGCGNATAAPRIGSRIAAGSPQLANQVLS